MPSLRSRTDLSCARLAEGFCAPGHACFTKGCIASAEAGVVGLCAAIIFSIQALIFRRKTVSLLGFPTRNGEVAEWTIVPDSKSGVPQGTVGSNPTLSASFVQKLGKWDENPRSGFVPRPQADKSEAPIPPSPPLKMSPRVAVARYDAFPQFLRSLAHGKPPHKSSRLQPYR